MDDYWQSKLSPEQFEVLRKGATEPPGSGTWLHNSESGVYVCAACGIELFGSETKFDSGTGWPSFWDAANTKNLRFIGDNTHGLERIEVKCAHCDSHLGHVFNDGPKPTGKRYCINSLSLDFQPSNEG